MGGKERDWGFYTKHGWMQWKKFVDAGGLGSVAWCEDRPETKESEK